MEKILLRILLVLCFLLIITIDGLAQQSKILSRDEAIQLALSQASIVDQAKLSEQSAAEDVKQAKINFLPKFSNSTSFIYTSPGQGFPPATPQTPSFIAANSVYEFITLSGATGELDISGRLRALLKRNQALLQAASSATEATRRTLIRATNETYYTFAFAVEQRRVAEQNLATAKDFEHITELLVQNGESAKVDLTRAHLQTTTRINELEQATAQEQIAANSLKVLIGYDFSQQIEVTSLSSTLPISGELDQFTYDLIAKRPELAQFEFQQQAIEKEIRLARIERRPQLFYSINGGFDSPSLRSHFLQQSSGVSASISLIIPIFDWGLSKSHEKQAQLRLKALDSTKNLALKSFAQDFYTAQIQAQSAEKRIKLLATSIFEAENNLSISIARYRGGEAAILEVTDAQNTLASGRLALNQAIYDYQIAKVRLLQIIGQ